MVESIKNPDDKMQELKNKQQPDQQVKAVPPICPFMSTPEKQVSCTPDCKLFRQGRRGYECYLQELQSISWNTRKPKQPTYAPPPSGPDPQY